MKAALRVALLAIATAAAFAGGLLAGSRGDPAQGPPSGRASDTRPFFAGF